MMISLDAKKSLQQNPTPLHDKGLGVIKNIRNVSKHNKGNIQETNQQPTSDKMERNSK